MPARRNGRRSTAAVDVSSTPNTTMPPHSTSPDATGPRRIRSSRALSTGPYPSSGPTPAQKRSGSQAHSSYSPSASATRLSPGWLPPSPASHPLMTFHKAAKRTFETKKKSNGPVLEGELKMSRDRGYSGESSTSEMDMGMIVPPGQLLSPPMTDARGLLFDGDVEGTGGEGLPGLPSLVPSEGSSTRSSLGDALNHNKTQAEYSNRGNMAGSQSLVNGLPYSSHVNGLNTLHHSGEHFFVADRGYDNQQAASGDGGYAHGTSPSSPYPAGMQMQYASPIPTTYHRSSYPTAMSYPPMQGYQAFPLPDGTGLLGTTPMSVPRNNDTYGYLSSKHGGSQAYRTIMPTSLPCGATDLGNGNQGTIDQSQMQSSNSFEPQFSGGMQSYSIGMAMDRSEMRTGEEEGSLSPGPSSGLDSSGDEDGGSEDEGDDGLIAEGNKAVATGIMAKGSTSADYAARGDVDGPGMKTEAGLPLTPSDGVVRKPSRIQAMDGDDLLTNRKLLSLQPTKRPTVAPEHWVHDDMRSLAASLSPNKGEFDQSITAGTNGHAGLPMTAAEKLAAAEKALHNGPPRPPNAWILYRSDKLKALANGEKLPGVEAIMAKRSSESPSEEDLAKGSLASGAAKAKKLKLTAKSAKDGAADGDAGAVVAQDSASKIPQADISKLISLMWKKEGKLVRNKYDRIAEVKKIEHQMRYPDYKFQPMKKEEKAKLRVERDIAKEHAKAAAKEDKQKLRKEQVEQGRKKRLAAKSIGRSKSLVPRQKTSRATTPPKEVDSESKVASGFGSPIASTLAKEGGFSANASVPILAATVEFAGRTRVTRKKKTSARSVHTAGPPSDWVATEDSIWRQPPRQGPSREVFWAVPPETDQVPLGVKSGYSSLGGPPLQGHEQYQIVEMGPQASGAPHSQQYRSLGNQYPYPPEQVSGWQSTSGSALSQGHRNIGVEPGYAMDGQQVIPYYFEPIPYQTQVAGHTNASVVSANRTEFPDEQPVVMTYSYLPDGGFGASEAIPGVSEAELAEMWALLQEEDGPSTEVANATIPMEEIWSTDPTAALEQWAELGPTIQDMTPVPTHTLSGQVVDRITGKWAGHSAQAQQGLRQSLEAPPPPMIPVSQSGGAVAGAIMSYDKPGYVTIQVPIDQMDQAFPGQALPMRGRNQGPFLTTEKPFSPIDTEFTMQPQYRQGMQSAQNDEPMESIQAMAPAMFTSLGQGGGELQNGSLFRSNNGPGRLSTNIYETREGNRFSADRSSSGERVSPYGSSMAGLGNNESVKAQGGVMGPVYDMASQPRSGPGLVPMYAGNATGNATTPGGFVEYAWARQQEEQHIWNYDDQSRDSSYYALQAQSSSGHFHIQPNQVPLAPGFVDVERKPTPLGNSHAAVADDSANYEARGDTVPRRGAKRSRVVGRGHQ